MEQAVLIFFVIVSAVMVGLILLQQGKGAEMGASFGSGSSQTVFGAGGGGNVLTRATAILAVLFFSGSFALAYLARDRARNSVDAGIPVPTVQQSDDVRANVEQALERLIDEIPSALDEPVSTQQGDDEIPAPAKD